MLFLLQEDSCRFLQILADSCRFLQILVDSCRFLQILADSCRFLQILADSCRFCCSFRFKQIFFQIHSEFSLRNAINIKDLKGISYVGVESKFKFLINFSTKYSKQAVARGGSRRTE